MYLQYQVRKKLEIIGVATGVSDMLVSTVDLFPTIIELGGTNAR